MQCKPEGLRQAASIDIHVILFVSQHNTIKNRQAWDVNHGTKT